MVTLTTLDLLQCIVLIKISVECILYTSNYNYCFNIEPDGIMVIREVGLLFRGFSLVKKSYYKTTLGKIDADLRSGLLTALLNFAETAFSTGSVEYFQGNRFILFKIPGCQTHLFGRWRCLPFVI